MKPKKKKYHTTLPSCWSCEVLFPCSWQRNRNQCHVFSWSQKQIMPKINKKYWTHSFIIRDMRILNWRD